MATTAHTHQVIFGRKFAGCPRCTELRLGMPPVRWSTARADADYQRLQAIRSHNCASSRCGPVCTAFDY